MFRMQLHLIAVLTTRCHRAIDPKIAIIATAVSTAFRIAYTMTRALIQAEWLMALLTQLAMVPIIQARAFVVDISIRIARFTPRGWRLEQRIVWPCPTRGELLVESAPMLRLILFTEHLRRGKLLRRLLALAVVAAAAICLPAR